MWSAVPKRSFSWDFWIRDAALQALAEVRLSSWRERGAVTAAGVEYTISRQGMLGPFVLEEGGVAVARAQKPSAFRNMFTLEHDGRLYTLKTRSMWRREMVLLEGGQEVGSLTPDGIFTRRARVNLPDALPLLLRLFMVWLTMLLWKRESDAAASTGAT